MWCGASSEAGPLVAWDDPIELLVEMGETLAGGGVRLGTAGPKVVKSSKWRYIEDILELSGYACLVP